MDNYHVLELVGEGSFGRVYKGRRSFGGQVVALKFMPKVGRSEKELRSLKREIEIMRGLEHPNIVQLYDSFETETEVVVVTEYAEGQLFQILEDDGKLPESQVREIACHLVSALYYLHSHRILHRDMKPQNILLGKSGVVKLCDFGFARAMSVSTLVLTSIKGTPLYMSPELVEEKPYDHTADLWSLGCILYELHTGMPPFYTNSIFHLVQLIVEEPVKWPDMMSDTCMSFLKGLLTKDPQKRLSWPDLLHHPFVADGVLVFADPDVCSPLTVTPSPDMMTQKLHQVAEKTVMTHGGSRLLQKARELRNNSIRRKPADHASANTKDQRENQRVHSATATKQPRAKPHHGDDSAASDHSVTPAADQILSSKSSWVRSKHRGQISKDYEKEFPSVELSSQLLRQSTDKHQQSTVPQQIVDGQEFWEELVQESDPFKENKEPFNYTAIIPILKVKLQAFKVQLTGGAEAWHVHQPLKVLRNLLLTSDLEESNHIGRELGLPHVLLDPVHENVENYNYIKQPWIVSALGEMIIVLMIYWEKHPDCMEEKHRGREEFIRPFVSILCEPDLVTLAPLAASVLSLCTEHNVDVKADKINFTLLMETLLLDSYKPPLSLPSGWGLFDGLLSLLLHLLTEHDGGFEGSSLDPGVFLNLWKKIGTSVAKTTGTDFCSAKGLFSFLSIALLVFTKDPHSCIPLFSVSESKCVYTLGRLLDTDCLHSFTDASPLWLEVDLDHYRLSMMSCQLMCFPFALDLPLHTMSTVLQLYDSCGIVESLVQAIQTLPILQLELPLSLLSHLLLCELSVCSLKRATNGFFTVPRDGLLSASKHQTPGPRTANSLLFDLLQLDVLWDSAAELLTLLSHVARRSAQLGCPQIELEASVLHQAMAHSHDQVRAGTCRLLGNLDPFRSSRSLQPDILKSLTGCLHDSCPSVRRMACRAVGKWFGYIAVWGFKRGGSNVKGSDNTKWSNQIKGSDSEATEAEQGMDDDEMRRWIDEARRTAATLMSLVTDPDDITRSHCCAALGNLVCADGAMSLLVEEEVAPLLE